MEGLPDFTYEPLHKNIKIGLLFIGLGFSVYFMWFLRKISKGKPIRLGKLGKMARLEKLGRPWKSWQSWRSKRKKSLGRMPSLGRIEKVTGYFNLSYFLI